jgi:hypothetical protein
MPKRVDANQVEIVQALRRCGCTVQVLSDVGKGCPDLLVSHRGLLFMVEVKDGEKPASKQNLTPDEKEWHAQWYKSPVFILRSLVDLTRMLELVEDHYVQAMR